jgi:hypothetical protein
VSVLTISGGDEGGSVFEVKSTGKRKESLIKTFNI